ncbi:hypothetical protein Ddc_07048 [Ditylenchus destructor]|nr:hypothetical protein Ddc_07048 [Ditylenchus destructor]
MFRSSASSQRSVLFLTAVHVNKYFGRVMQGNFRDGRVEYSNRMGHCNSSCSAIATHPFDIPRELRVLDDCIGQHLSANALQAADGNWNDSSPTYWLAINAIHSFLLISVR